MHTKINRCKRKTIQAEFGFTRFLNSILNQFVTTKQITYNIVFNTFYHTSKLKTPMEINYKICIHIDQNQERKKNIPNISKFDLRKNK